jgi:predicted  nucleic acid-binding Zn-ribbon protein
LAATTPFDAQRRLEAQRRYDQLTARIAALDTDIGRELDSEHKFTMQQARTELAKERDTAVSELSALGWEPQHTATTIEGRVATVEETQRDHGGRLTAIERHIHPPWIVTFWRVMAVLSVVVGLTAAAKWPQVLFELYLPIGIIVEAAFVIIAFICVLQANAQLERDK